MLNIMQAIDGHAGLHAILPEAVLLALATECPSTASLVIECAQRAMHNEQPAGTQQNGEAYLQKRALPYLREQADHVGDPSINSATASKTSNENVA